jgi:general secretion pathway protein A
MPLLPDRDATSTAWLRERVASDAAEAAGISLPEAVRGFQSAHGLLADAVIGPETLFALAANDPGPHLLRTLD